MDDNKLKEVAEDIKEKAEEVVEEIEEALHIKKKEEDKLTSAESDDLKDQIEHEKDIVDNVKGVAEDIEDDIAEAKDGKISPSVIKKEMKEVNEEIENIEGDNQ